MEQEITNFSQRFPTPQAREVAQPTVQLTPHTIANKSGIAHKSAKTLKFRLDANFEKIRHGVNRFKLTALRDFCTDRPRMPFFERIHPPKHIATTSNVDSYPKLISWRNTKGPHTIVGFNNVVKGKSFILNNCSSLKDERRGWIESYRPPLERLLRRGVEWSDWGDTMGFKVCV